MRIAPNWILALCFPVAVLAAKAVRDPRIGYWVQQAGPDSVGVQQYFEDLGDGRIRLRLSGLTVEARCDGRRYPFMTANGKPAGRTYSCRITAPSTVEYVYTQEGGKPWTISAGTETVSTDGNTLIHIGVRRDADGNVVENLRQEYRRREKS